MHQPSMYQHIRSLRAVAALLIVGAVVAGAAEAKQYPKLAPFSGVRWEGDVPVVKIDKQWFTLISLDGIAVEEIVAFGQRTYAGKWQKRFGEDLVELLASMGHKPKRTVRLVVSPLGDSAQQTLERVAMTEANRQAVRASVNNAGGRRPPTQPTAATSAPPEHLTDEWVEQVAAPMVENKIADGLSIGYIDGKHWGIVHLGTATRSKKKADNLTIYEIGSITKVFTSLLLADAVVRGDIDLNAPADVTNTAGIQLPSRDGRAIKWIDLSTHRSGLPRLPTNLEITVASMKDPYRDYDSKKAAEFLSEYQLPRQPGESQEYSNFGVSVLGYLNAQHAGKTYDQLLRDRIAKPLRMSDCTVKLNSKHSKRRALPHDKFGSPTLPWSFADLPGAGGIHATMRDMMRFAKAQLTPPEGTLGEAIELAWKQQCEADSSGPATGLGWMIAGDGQTRWHNGGTGGSRSALFINRESNRAVVVLCNTSVSNEIDQLAMQLVSLKAGQGATLASSETSDGNADNLAIDEELRGRLLGRYQLAPKFIFHVSDRDGQLMVGATDQPTLRLSPDSPTHWSCKEVNATIEFKLPKTGPANSLVLHQNGAKQTARRIKGDLAIDAALRDRLEGRYQLNPNFIFDVKDRDEHLMVTITNQPTNEVFPDSPTRWSYQGIDATLEFKLPKAGPAKSLVLIQNGAAQTANRMK